MERPTNVKLVVCDADSIVYAAGHACETQCWRVWPRSMSIDMEEDKPEFEFSKKDDLNKWLKSQDINPRKMTTTKDENGKPLEVYNDQWYCYCIRGVEPIANCLNTVKAMLNNIKDGTGAKDMFVYLTAGGGFRAKLYPEYKANRDPGSKPLYYDEIRDYMVRVWDATIFDDLEADDAAAIDVTEFQENFGVNSVVLASIDKDLNQVPGWHYNYQKELELNNTEFYFVTRAAGRKQFFMQMLMGDSSDNIPGIKGVGEKTAEKMLAGCESLEDYERVVKTAYAEENDRRKAEEEPALKYELNASLLFMRRESKDDNWRDWI